MLIDKLIFIPLFVESSELTNRERQNKMTFLKRFNSKAPNENDRANDTVNIGVWGSCCTRDIFNSKFIADYKEHYNITVDQQHISVISMMSRSVKLNLQKLEGNVSPFFKKVFVQDMEKDFFSRLKKEKPAYLLVDFYTDVRYGAALLNNGKYITNKLWQYKKLSVYNQLNIAKRFSISKNPDQFIELWCEQFDAFMKKIKQITPETEVVINTPKFVNVGFDGEKKIVLSENRSDDFKSFHIDRFNILWKLFDTYAIYKYNLKSITFDLDKYYCPKDHP